MNSKITLKLIKNKKGTSSSDFLLILIIAVLIFIVFYTQYKNNAVVSNETNSNALIDVTQDPVQTATLAYFNAPLEIKINNKLHKLYPQADYKISGMVVGKNDFFFMDDGSDISPLDIGLAWGKMADAQYDKYMTYRSANRFLNWNYTKEFPFSYDYLNSHVSNNHIIPSSNNILKVLKSVKLKENIYLEGYLVNLRIDNKDSAFIWNTSLSRNDKEAGACELFYVKKVRVGKNFYE